MKVNIYNDILKLQSGEKLNQARGKAGSTGKAGSFSSLLEKASGAFSTEKAGAATGPQPGIGLAGPFFSPLQQQAVETGEEALALLEHCGCLLEQHGSAGQSLLDTVASALDSSAEDLVSARDALDAGDPLRAALDEIAVMSVVASMKIGRGDFDG